MVHEDVKKLAESRDIRGLQYVFVDCLDVDPTFEKYRDDFDYCLKNVPEMFAGHEELGGLSGNKTGWNDDYWDRLKNDLLKNFSVKRFEHMRDVARVVYAEKITRLEQERRGSASRPEIRSESTPQRPAGDMQAQPAADAGRRSDSVNMQQTAYTEIPASKTQKELEEGAKRQLETKKQMLEEENQFVIANIHKADSDSGQWRVEPAEDNGSKKVIGAVILIVIIVIIIMVILKVMIL